MRPALDGDPQDPPGFRKPSKSSGERARSGAPGRFGSEQALAAGSTGFDSSNTRRSSSKARQQPTRVTTSAQPANPASPNGVAAPSSITANSGAPQRSGPPAATRFPPRQLQPAAALLAARIYNQTRPGAPPLDPEAETATVATIPPSRRLAPEEKPFDPLGMQVGAFIFRPGFEYSRGYDNNVPRNSGPPRASSWFDIYAPELLVNTNWARHEFTATLRGSYLSFDTNHTYDRPNVDSRANLRIDITSESRLELEGRYLLFTDYPGNPNIQAGIARLPIAHTYGSTVGIGQRFNRLDVALKGTFDRTTYNDSEFTDGSTASNAGRNFDKYGTLLRTTYEVMPGVLPFVEAGADIREYDLPIDAAGMMRSSHGLYGKVGTSLTLPPRLIGEVSFGYLQRVYADPLLRDIRGPTVDASLTWLATALTSLKLTAVTAVTESTLFGVSGAFTRDVTLELDHAFRRWLVATLKFTRGIDIYVGSPREDIRYIASSALTYTLSRDLLLKGEYRQEWRYSNIPNSNYWAHVWLLGVRLQR